MNKLLFFILLISQGSCFACAVPFSGEKYDSQITFEKYEKDYYIDTNAYVISFPATVDSLKYTNAEVTIYDKKDSLDLKSYISIPIVVKEYEGKMTGIIRVSKKSNLSFNVQVIWSPKSIGLCSIYAYKYFSD